MAMEKNAVLGQPAPRYTTKTASAGCPRCGARLDASGSIPRCPTHGTAPFEYGAQIAQRGSGRR